MSDLIFTGILLGNGTCAGINSARFLTRDGCIVNVQRKNTAYTILDDMRFSLSFENPFFCDAKGKEHAIQKDFLVKFLGFVYDTDSDLEAVVDECMMDNEYYDISVSLTRNDKVILRSWGYVEKDFRQIQEAIDKSSYLINYRQEITALTAVELLGRDEFLSGISRSAFHYTASREISDIGSVVAFDSSCIFE